MIMGGLLAGITSICILFLGLKTFNLLQVLRLASSLLNVLITGGMSAHLGSAFSGKDLELFKIGCKINKEGIDFKTMFF